MAPIRKARSTSGRRKQYAEQTRQAVIAAARELFAANGYSQTKVDDIAALARVSPMTIYGSLGGKAGLLRILMDVWSAAPGNEVALDLIRKEHDAIIVIDLVAGVVRQMREEFGDIAYFMHDAAPHEPEVMASLLIATSRYRAWCAQVIKHLQDLDALRPDLTKKAATEILWFFFGYWGFYTLHNENGWSYARAEKWLAATAREALLLTRDN